MHRALPATGLSPNEFEALLRTCIGVEGRAAPIHEVDSYWRWRVDRRNLAPVDTLTPSRLFRSMGSHEISAQVMYRRSERLCMPQLDYRPQRDATAPTVSSRGTLNSRPVDHPAGLRPVAPMWPPLCCSLPMDNCGLRGMGVTLRLP